jgi:hypothetical protein
MPRPSSPVGHITPFYPRIQKFMKNTKSKKLIFLFLEIFDNLMANSKVGFDFYQWKKWKK